MRLWHVELIRKGLLPNSQLISQWRELNSIFKKQDKHILINYIYEYKGCADLALYSKLVIEEMVKRGYKIKSFDNMYSYFEKQGIGMQAFLSLQPSTDSLFCKHHDKQYLLICFMNLYEKKIRGQKDFSDDCFNKMYDYVNQFFNLKQLGIIKISQKQCIRRRKK